MNEIQGRKTVPDLRPVPWLDKRRIRRAAKLLQVGTLTQEEYDALVVRAAARVLGRRIEPGSRIDHATFTTALILALTGDNPSDADMEESFERYGPYNYSVITLGSGLGGVRDTGQTFELVWATQADDLYLRARAKIGRLSGWLLRAEGWLSQQRRLFPNLSPALEKMILAGVSFVAGLFVGCLG